MSELQQRLLWALYQEAQPVSLPWLGKQLGVSGSAVMRALATLGDAPLAGEPGPGWVRVDMADARWTACLTDAGRALCSAQPPADLDTRNA